MTATSGPAERSGAERVLVTGAAGGLATLVLGALRREGRVLRLLDSAPIAAATEADDVISGSITDAATMLAACAGVDAVIHLAGLSTESDWPSILAVNIDGSHTVLEAARAAGVPRVVLASSNHAVGFAPVTTGVVPDYLFPRPDTYYGLSKVAIEGLGSLYHDRYGLDVVCLRIGSCFAEPRTRRALSTWLSPADAGRLLEAALTAPSPGFRVVWGVSANTRIQVSLAEGHALGYHPVDDAERYASDDLPTHPLDHLVGGAFCDAALDDHTSTDKHQGQDR